MAAGPRRPPGPGLRVGVQASLRVGRQEGDLGRLHQAFECGPGEQIPLLQMDAIPQQHIPFADGFDPLCDDVNTEITAHGGHAVDDGLARPA